MDRAEKTIEMMDGMKPWQWLVTKLSGLIGRHPLGINSGLYTAESKDGSGFRRSAKIYVFQNGSYVDMAMRPEAREEPSIQREQVEHPEIFEIIDRAIQLYETYQQAVRLIEEP